MIFLHTSDWHLGATEGEQELREDQYFFIDEICRIIEERQVDAVLLAGDVYDRWVCVGHTPLQLCHGADLPGLEKNGTDHCG